MEIVYVRYVDENNYLQAIVYTTHIKSDPARSLVTGIVVFRKDKHSEILALQQSNGSGSTDSLIEYATVKANTLFGESSFSVHDNGINVNYRTLGEQRE